ncbi:hypothetical protein D7W79_16965 [Corallococcus exercitus]|nr:hypothetical protein D7W79_16965 [Corallococcus exercitus]
MQWLGLFRVRARTARALSVLFLMAVMAGATSASAAPCSANDTSPHTCSQGLCKGVAYCEGTQLGECFPTGESSVSCSVCGRTGYKTCSDFSVNAESCSAYRSELCNGCDDDGNGQVDEGLAHRSALHDAQWLFGRHRLFRRRFHLCPGT